jgi:hypothetical protein
MFRRDAWQAIIPIFLATRLGIFAAGAVAVSTLGMDRRPLPAPMTKNIVLDLPGRWDAHWYVGVASRGYQWNLSYDRFQNIAFFPLYPMTLRAVATVLMVPRTSLAWTWVGSLLSLGFFLAALRYLYGYAHRRLDASAARWSVALVSAYPFAIFFGLAYTEALFLLSAVAACYHAQRDQHLGTAAWGLAAGLTRPNGILVSLLLLPAWSDLVGGMRANRPWLMRRLAAASAPVAGVLCFSLYAYVQSGSMFSWAAAQHSAGRTHVPLNVTISNVYSQVVASGLIGYVVERPYDFLNGFAALFMIALAVPVARALGFGAGLFLVASVLAPLSVGGLPSLGRYTSVLFPAHLYLATRLSGAGRITLLVLFAIGQALVAALFFTWRPMH